MLKGFIRRLGKKKSAKAKKAEPIIIPRKEHSISRNAINPHALKVLYRLHNAGYSAYLVGGCVRDLLLGQQPKDFDIATDAHPEDIRKLFKNCRLIGKRFRLAHIVFGKEIIEVATFRTHHHNAHEHHAKSSHQGMILRDNVYGDIEDDVWRRDFSINALYYNIADFSIVDYTGGMADIQARLLRIIGDPEQRFQEDPVRLLRCVRFSGKLNIAISLETENAMTRFTHLLQHVSSARLFQEVLKFFQEGATYHTFKLLQKYHLLEQLFPQTSACLVQIETQILLDEALKSTDNRAREGKTVSPAFLFTVFLWRPIAAKTAHSDLPFYVALEQAIQIVLKSQSERLAMTRILTTSIREICLLQHYLTHNRGSRPYKTLEHPRFRAAYDLLLLRAKAGEPVHELAHWWTQFQQGDSQQKEKLLKQSPKPAQTKKRRSRQKKKTVSHKDLPTT